MKFEISFSIFQVMAVSENPFLKKFKEKSRKQLEEILENPENYQPMAIEAATLALKEKGENEERQEDQELGTDFIRKHEVDKKDKFGWKHIKSVSKNFFKDYSSKVALTHLTTGLMYSTVILIFDFYRGEDETLLRRDLTITVFVPSLILFNHWLYQRDIKKRLNYTRRCLNDLFLFLYYGVMVTITSSLFYDRSISLDLQLLIITPIAILFISAIFELLVEFVILLYMKVVRN